MGECAGHTDNQAADGQSNFGDVQRGRVAQEGEPAGLEHRPAKTEDAGSSPATAPAGTHGGQQGVPNYGIARDYPLLWEKSLQFDFAERLGGCTDPLMAEIDQALRELWSARQYVSEGHPS